MFERNDRYLGLGCVILGVFAYMAASQWKVMVGSDPAGPGGIPKILSVGIAVIGVILIAGSYLMKNQQKDKPLFTRKELMIAVSLTAICLVYILVLPYIGYLLATPLFIASILLSLGSRKAKSILLISVIATLVLFLMFYSVLKVNLPLGFTLPFIKSLGLRW